MLQGYFDGELSGEMMERATLHLAVCSTCAAAAREMEEEIHLLATALAPELDARVPTEQLRKRIDAAVSDLRVGARSSSRERSGFGAFISSLLSFGTQRTLGYASLVMLLAFAAIFGLVKLRTAPEQLQAQQQQQQQQQAQQLPQHQPQDQVAANSPSVSSVPSVFKTEPQKNTDRPYKAVKVTHRTVSAPVAAAAPASEQVKLLPGERAYLQTIAKLDSTIKANQKAMRPSLQFEYERNLAVVDRAIAATRSAAKKTPNDPDTADFMFAAYQSKVDLLNTIADARLGGGRSH
jgi:hypothetical protein